MLNYKISYTTSSSGQQRWEWGTQLRVVDNFQNSRMTWNALWKIISVILAKQSCSLESFPLNTSFNSVCNNRWKYKRKEVVGPVSAFEVNSLKQRVTVNDCHPCSAHPMLWSLRDFTTVQLRVVLARPQWPQVSRQLPQSGRVVCFESFRSHKWKTMIIITFMHDGAPCHKPKASRKCLDNHQINIFDPIPGNSPDQEFMP